VWFFLEEKQPAAKLGMGLNQLGTVSGEQTLEAVRWQEVGNMGKERVVVPELHTGKSE